MSIYGRDETSELPESLKSSRDGYGFCINSQFGSWKTQTLANSRRHRPGAHVSMPWKDLSLQLDHDETNAKFNPTAQTNASPSSADAQVKALWLEIFNELYNENEELCKKVLSKIQQEILLKEGPKDFRAKAWLELVEKIPTILQKTNLNQSKGLRMQRSLSLDSPRKIFVEKPSTEGPEDSRVKAWLELFLKKIPTLLYQAILNRNKVGTLQRSLSLESPRTPRRSGEESTMRLKRFNVLTLDLGGIQQDGKGGTKETKK